VVAHGFDPTVEIILEGMEDTDRSCTGGTLTSFEVLEEHPNRVTIALAADGPGWLFQADVWFPGWIARVDGEQAPLYSANYLFRAVSVPTGFHEIEIIYRPYSFYLGVLISLCAWIWMGVRFVRERR
jgi:uncharacterized membrane protein YfhO